MTSAANSSRLMGVPTGPGNINPLAHGRSFLPLRRLVRLPGEFLTDLAHSDTPFHQDLRGKRLATGSCDNTAKVWDATGGQELLILRGHKIGNASYHRSQSLRRDVLGTCTPTSNYPSTRMAPSSTGVRSWSER